MQVCESVNFKTDLSVQNMSIIHQTKQRYIKCYQKEAKLSPPSPPLPIAHLSLHVVERGGHLIGDEPGLSLHDEVVRRVVGGTRLGGPHGRLLAGAQLDGPVELVVGLVVVGLAHQLHTAQRYLSRGGASDRYIQLGESCIPPSDTYPGGTTSGRQPRCDYYTQLGESARTSRKLVT